MAKKVKQDCFMALVRFTDDVFHIAKVTNINITKENSYAVRYTDRGKYAANLLILSADLHLLKYIQKHLEGDISRIQIENVVYTGTKLAGSQILLQKHLKASDKKKIWVHETLLLSSDKKAADSYVIKIGENSAAIDADTHFLEVDLSNSEYTEVPETKDNGDPQSELLQPEGDIRIPSADDSPPSTVRSTTQLVEKGVPEMNVNESDETNVSQPIQDTVTATADDSPSSTVRSTTQLVEKDVPEMNVNESDGTNLSQPIQDTVTATADDSPSSTVRSTTQLVEEDVPEMNVNESDGTNVSQPIQDTVTASADDSPSSTVRSTTQLVEHKVPEMKINETDEVDISQPIHDTATSVELRSRVHSEYEREDRIVGKKIIESSESTTTSIRSKPKIIAIEDVKFDLVRARHLVDASYGIGSSLSFEDEHEQDSFMSNNLPDYILDGSLDNMILGDIHPSHNDFTNDLELPAPFDTHSPLPMSSTVLESTSLQNTVTTNTEDSTHIDDTTKDEDYDVNGQSHSMDTATSSDLPDMDAALTNPADDESQNTKPFLFQRPDKMITAPDDATMKVSDSSTPSHKKKYFCLYCHKMQTKLARHLELVHADQEDVKKFIHLPKGCRERQDIIAIIRKNGNHVYNTDERFNEGTLLTCRRPNVRMLKNAQDFTACGNCKGQYAKSVIRHHFRKCTQINGKTERIVMVKGRAVMARINKIATEDVLWKVFSYLREDEVVRAIRYDELLILFANKQGHGHGANPHLYQMIRARLRLLGRFLLAIRKVNPTVTDFASIYRPGCYDSCILAVRDVAIFQNETRRFTHPAVASGVGTLLKHVGELLRSKYIKSEEEKKQKQVEDFLKLLKEDYGTSINKAVAETQLQNDRRKKVKLPSAEDIAKLQDYLKTMRQKYFKILQVEFCYKAWRKLAEVTLISLQTFNRRRAGEIERLFIEDFKSYEGIDAFADKDVFNSLSKEAQQLAKHYVRFMIRGKRGRGVPVLVPSHLLQCMNIIEKFRLVAKVPANNPYFFGLPSNDPDRHKYLRACNLLRQYSVECGAKVPESLRGTKLRKHIATHCINLNLSETQVNDLANFMGHHEKIHKDIYRQPIVERDITKISKLLEFAQGTCDPRDGEASESNSDDEIADNNDHQNDIQPLQDKQHTNTDNVRSLKTNFVGSKTKKVSPAASRKKNSRCNKRSRIIPESDTDEDEISESLHDEHIASPKNMTSPKIYSAAKKTKIVHPAGRDTRKKPHHESENIPVTRRSWTGAEKIAVLKAFSKYFEGKRLPSLSEIQDLISKTKCLQDRSAPQVKTWLHNERRKMSL